MAKQILQRYGTAADLNPITGTAGTNREIALVVDGSGIATGDIRVMDGVTKGGIIHKPFPQTGTVLQVVNFDTTTQTSSTTNSYTATGITASITPSSTSSKILVTVYYDGGLMVDNGPEAVGFISLSKDSGSTFISTHRIRDYDYGQSGQIAWHMQSFQYLDSPNTTSELTYTVYHKKEKGTNILHSNNGSNSGITLMEISG